MLDLYVQNAQPNKVLAKMAAAIRLNYLTWHQEQLETRMMLFNSLVLSHVTFKAIIFQNHSCNEILLLNQQINWGIRNCLVKNVVDRLRILVVKSDILPQEQPLITKMSNSTLWYFLARLLDGKLNGQVIAQKKFSWTVNITGKRIPFQFNYISRSRNHCKHVTVFLLKS